MANFCEKSQVKRDFSKNIKTAKVHNEFNQPTLG